MDRVYIAERKSGFLKAVNQGSFRNVIYDGEDAFSALDTADEIVLFGPQKGVFQYEIMYSNFVRTAKQRGIPVILVRVKDQDVLEEKSLTKVIDTCNLNVAQTQMAISDASLRVRVTQK